MDFHGKACKEERLIHLLSWSSHTELRVWSMLWQKFVI